MEPHDPFETFETEEFSRYAAECRRMARFARPPERKKAPAIAFATRSKSADWPTAIRMLYPRLAEHRGA